MADETSQDKWSANAYVESKHKKKSVAKKMSYPGGMTKKDFHKDTRTPFMKELDQHKVDRLKYK